MSAQLNRSVMLAALIVSTTLAAAQMHGSSAPKHGSAQAPGPAHGHDTRQEHAKSQPQDLDLARSKPSAHGMFHVVLSPNAEPVGINALHSWTVRLTDANGQPVEDADIRVDGGMPEHGHGLPTQPQVTRYLGDGTYLLEGVRFTMHGWWSLDLMLRAGDRHDAATFNLLIE